MIIGYNYLDQYGYFYGIQNRSNYLLTKYSNIHYTVAEIEQLYSVVNITELHKAIEITGLYSTIEIISLHTVTLLSE